MEFIIPIAIFSLWVFGIAILLGIVLRYFGRKHSRKPLKNLGTASLVIGGLVGAGFLLVLLGYTT